MAPRIINLIQYSLHPEMTVPLSPSEQDWCAIYEEANRQALAGLTFYGVQQLRKNHPDCAIPENLWFEWLSQVLEIQKRNESLDAHCQQLQKELSESGIRSSILKGQAMAQLYGDTLSSLRQPGDIDIFVDCGRERAIEYAHSLGDSNPQWDYKHLHLKRFIGTEVEMHYVPEVLMNLRKNKRLQKWFEVHKEEIFTKYDGLVTPSIRFNLFYILLHIYRHFLYEGIGMRQLLDYYFVLKAAHGKNKEEVIADFKQFGMIRFARGVMWIMQYAFLLEDECLICNADEKEGKYILDQVMRGGNFGHYDKRLSNSPDGKIGSVWRVIKHNLHLLSHYPADVLWAPIWIVWHWCWKRAQLLKTR